MPEFVAPDGHLHRVRLLLRVLRLVGRARARYVDMIVERLALGPDEPRGRAGVERRLSPAALPPHGHPGARHRAGTRTSPRPRSTAASRRSSSSSGTISGVGSPASAAGRPRARATTCSRRYPTSTTSSAGSPRCCADDGTATFEFPHVATLLEHVEYDTIYHEHFSYFSLIAIREIFGAQGLALVDVEEMPTHGGSLRVYLAPCRGGSRRADAAVGALLAREDAAGLRDPDVPPVRRGVASRSVHCSNC